MKNTKHADVMQWAKMRPLTAREKLIFFDALVLAELSGMKASVNDMLRISPFAWPILDNPLAAMGLSAVGGRR